MGVAAGDEAAVAAAMRTAVKRLNFGAAEEIREEAAREVARLARTSDTDSDGRTKRRLAELGVVPPLLSMLADARGAPCARLAGAAALLELARGTHRNKVHMVKAGLLKMLPRLMEDKDLSRSRTLALLLLSISTLVNTDFPLSSSELLPYLVATLSDGEVPADTKLPCLAALHNLSAKLEHVRDVVSSGAVRALLALISVLDEKAPESEGEEALSILGSLAAASAAGRKELEEDAAAARALVEAMTWHGRARCQEHATYLVMVLAHGDGGGAAQRRRRMRRVGVVQALLEVSLLGSPLAQRRAAKVLQWFKDEEQSRIRAHSGPRMEGASSSCHGDAAGVGSSSNDCGGGNDAAEDRRSAVHRIVKQSLDRNMNSIMRRATASVDLTSVNKLLVASSSSMSSPC